MSRRAKRGRALGLVLGGVLAVVVGMPGGVAAAPIAEQGITSIGEGYNADWIVTGPDGRVTVSLLNGTSNASLATFTGTTPGRPVACLYLRQPCRTGAIAAGPGGIWFVTTVPINNDPVHSGPTIGSLAGDVAGPVQELLYTDLPFGIAMDRTGVLWATLTQGVLVRYDPVALTLERFALAEYTNGPSLLALGADGAMWFTEKMGNKIGRIATEAPELVGSVTQYAVPTPRAGLYGIAPGPDGAMWFGESRAGAVGRIAPDGSVQEFKTGVKGSTPRNLVAGPDNAMWFTDPGADSIGRITMDGRITEYPLPATKGISNKVPNAITLGGDGFLWFTENNNGPPKLGRKPTIGRLDPNNPPAAAKKKRKKG